MLQSDLLMVVKHVPTNQAEPYARFVHSEEVFFNERNIFFLLLR